MPDGRLWLLPIAALLILLAVIVLVAASRGRAKPTLGEPVKAAPPAPASAPPPPPPPKPVPIRTITQADFDNMTPSVWAYFNRRRGWPPDNLPLPVSQWPTLERERYQRDRCNHCLQYWQRHAAGTRQEEARINSELSSRGHPPIEPRDLSCREECAALSQPQPAAQQASQPQAPQQSQQPEEARRPQPYVGYYGNNGWPWEQNKKR